MSKVAFVFPGQGSQTVGMGKELCDQFQEARAVFAAVDDALHLSLSRICFEGPEDALKLTANTQPAILTVSAAAQAVLASRVPAPAFVAGHSLGEYSALVAAGSIGLADAARTVRSRGTFMQEAVPEGSGAMAAVLGLTADQVRACCEAAQGQGQGEVVSPANFNSPEQTVIAGSVKAVERATQLLKEAGAKRVVPLPVSAPFHCALMSPVKPRLQAVLEPIAVARPKMPVVSNVEATPSSDPARTRGLLVEQVTAPVRWVETIEALVKLGVSRFVEVGPGKVLSGLNRRIVKEIEVLNVEDAASLEKTIAALAA